MTNEYKNYEEEYLRNNLGFIFCPSSNYVREKCVVGKASYDEIYNTYKTKISLTLKLKMPEDKILNYVITVPFNWKSNKPPYLRGLTTQGTINLDLLNSGKSTLRGYRFYNYVNEGRVKIALNFELYPKPGTSFTGLTLKFYDVYGNSVGSPYNYPESIKDTTIIDFSLSDYGLQTRKLYKVEISYKDCDGETVTDYSNYWLLTTALFNDCFSPGEENYIANYCNPLGNEDNILQKKLTIKVKLNNENINITNDVSYSTNGSLINTSGNIDFTSILTNTVSIDSSGLELEIENPEYYPDHIIFDKDSAKKLIQAKLNVDNSNDLFKEIYPKIANPFNDSTSNYLYAEDSDSGIKIISKERICGTGTKALNLTNIFVRMSEALPYLLEKTNLYCGVFPDIDYNTDTNFFGGDGKDILMAFIIKSNILDGYQNGGFSDPESHLNGVLPGSTIVEGQMEGYLLNWYEDGTDFSINNNESLYDVNGERLLSNNIINNGFNHFMGLTDLPCTYLFTDLDNDRNLHYTNRSSREEGRFAYTRSASTNTIIWWRSKDDLDHSFWRASKRTIKKDEFSNSDLVKVLFGLDFYFCFVSNTGVGDSGLYIPDLGLNKKLTFNDEITINLPIKISSSIPTGIFKDLDKLITFHTELDEEKTITKTITINHDNKSLTEILLGIGLLELIDNVKGRRIDSDGHTLDSKSIYIESNGELKKVSINPFIIDHTTTFLASNGFVCRYIYCNEDINKVKNTVGCISIPDRVNDISCIDYSNGDLRIYFRNVPLIPLIT